MQSVDMQPAFSFHIERGEPGDHTVPATVLVQILENAQRAFELIGVHAEGREIKARARISANTSRRFQLVCQLPKPGCYAMPVTVGGAGDLFIPELAEKAFGIFRDVMASVSAHDPIGLSAALPDARIRRRVLEAVKGMAPRADATWRLSLHDSGDTPFAHFDIGTVPFVQATIVPPEEREASKVVTGELKSIDFAARRFSIIYPPAQRELECIYEDAVEELLIENRRELVQVTGRVLLDEQGVPKQIIDVNDIRDLDLSPLVIDTIHHAGRSLKAMTPLTLEPTTDETKQLLCLEHAELGIDVYAPTREVLVAELNEQIAMLWSEYALADDDCLDAVAVRLKQTLLVTFVEAGDAT
jgi:hypothetical protein